jgi:hypothetical protein
MMLKSDADKLKSQVLEDVSKESLEHRETINPKGRAIRSTVTNLKSINFRKREFSIGGENFYLKSIVNTLMKPPTQRSQAEIDVIMQMALSQQGKNGEKSFFRSFLEEHGESQLNKLLQYCYYE